MKNMKTGFKLALVAASICTASSVLAQAPVKLDEKVLARQGLMQLQKLNRGAINAVVKGEAEMSPATTQAAANLAALATMLPMVFPADTGLDKFPDSNAKPEIWQKQADFKARYEKLQGESAKLAEVAKGKDVAKLGDQLKRVADACTACHDDFRRDPTKK